MNSIIYSIFYIVLIRFVRGATKHSDYTQSSDIVPDVCCLMKKAITCVGKETSYDWHDYFKENCTAWQQPGESRGNQDRGLNQVR